MCWFSFVLYCMSMLFALSYYCQVWESADLTVTLIQKHFLHFLEALSSLWFILNRNIYIFIHHKGRNIKNAKGKEKL